MPISCLLDRYLSKFGWKKVWSSALLRRRIGIVFDSHRTWTSFPCNYYQTTNWAPNYRREEHTKRILNKRIEWGLFKLKYQFEIVKESEDGQKRKWGIHNPFPDWARKTIHFNSTDASMNSLLWEGARSRNHGEKSLPPRPSQEITISDHLVLQRYYSEDDSINSSNTFLLSN